MSLLLDSSAIVSCLVTTPSRDFFIESVTADPEWFASAISLNECVALVPLLNELAPEQAVLEEEIHRMWSRVAVVPVDATCLQLASEIAREHRIGFSQSLNISSCLRLPARPRILTADPNLISAAIDHGFEVIAP